MTDTRHPPVSFNKDDNYLAVIYNSRVHVWDMNTCELRESPTLVQCTCLTWMSPPTTATPGKKRKVRSAKPVEWVAIGTASGDVVIWDILQAESRATMTKRNNQIAFLRRIHNKQDCTPRVEVVSSYSDPDYAELNYHAGADAHSNIGCLETIHIGVQSSKDNTKAEILTAILLLYTCKHPDAHLGKLRIDLVKGLPQLGKVLLGDKIDGISVVKKDYRKRLEDKVQLYCYCKTP